MQQSEIEQLLTDLKSTEVDIATRAGWRLTTLDPALYTPGLVEKIVDCLEDAPLVTTISIKRVLEKIPDLAKPALLRALVTTNPVKLNEVITFLLDYDELDEASSTEIVRRILTLDDHTVITDYSQKLFESRHKPLALKSFLNLLTKADAEVAGKIIFAIHSGLPGREGEEILAELLQHPDAEIRHQLIKGFIFRSGQEIAQHPSLEAALVQLLDDSDPTVQSYAISVVSSRELVTPQIFKKFEGFLMAENPAVAANATMAIAYHPDFVSPTTIEKISNNFSNLAKPLAVRESAATALALLGAKAQAALPLLQQNFAQAETELKIWIAVALVMLKPEFKTELEFLARILQNPAYQETTLKAIGIVGEAAKPLAKQISLLVPLAHDYTAQHFRTGASAIIILGRIAPELLLDYVTGGDVALANNISAIISGAGESQLLALLEPLAQNGDAAAQLGVDRIRTHKMQQVY